MTLDFSFRFTLTLAFAFTGLELAQADELTSSISQEEALEQHQTGAEDLSIDQDKQSGNVQQLIDEQTNQQVLKLLNEIEILMAQATDRLEDGDTGGDTLAIQTEIIEKIYEAAKARNGEGSSSQNGGSMLEMLEMMMGKTGESKPPKDGQGQRGGEAPQGSSSGHENQLSATGEIKRETTETRCVPRSTGMSGSGLPSEFQKALDAYNRTSREQPQRSAPSNR